MTKFILPSLLFICNGLFAQTDITVKEEMVAIDGTSRNSLTVVIPGAKKAEDVKRAWKKQLKDLKGKVSDKKVIFADDCKSKEMGDNSFDVYSLVEEASDAGVKLVAAFDLGGAYLSTAAHPDRYPAAQKIVSAFAVAQAKAVIQDEIDGSEKILKGAEKALAGLIKDKGDLEKSIEDYKKKILEAEEAISNNQVAQANMTKEIEGMKAILLELSAKQNAVK